MKKKVIFWGSASHAVVLEELISYSGTEIVAVFDNDTSARSPIDGVPIYFKKEGFERWMSQWQEEELYFAVAIGGEYGAVRLEIHDYLKGFGLRPFQCVHPSSFIANNATIGEGCHVLIKSAICARSKLGRSVILNTLADIDHECTIGDGAHVSANVIVAGGCTIGSNAFIGVGAAILPRLTVGNNAIIGAGAVVTRDVPDNAVAYGNPAKVHYYRDEVGNRIEIDTTPFNRK
jgi:sugar O-acyltransferase (sialic acid O-acetyltransferase NeuD family)